MNLSDDDGEVGGHDGGDALTRGAEPHVFLPDPEGTIHKRRPPNEPPVTNLTDLHPLLHLLLSPLLLSVDVIYEWSPRRPTRQPPSSR